MNIKEKVKIPKFFKRISTTFLLFVSENGNSLGYLLGVVITQRNSVFEGSWFLFYVLFLRLKNNYFNINFVKKSH